VVEPLRADWANAQAAAMVLAREADELDGKKREAKLEEARAEVRRFHHALCTVRVLDPACGSGNFLYVTLEHLKRLEGEVLNQLDALGTDTDATRQDKLGLEGETVTLQQLRGIEINARAAALAELVLWIGYLQWHIRTRGNKAVAEPVVHDYGNIECRDAVLAWDDAEPAYDERRSAADALGRQDLQDAPHHRPEGARRQRAGAAVALHPAAQSHLAAGRLYCGQPALHWRRAHARALRRWLCGNAARGWKDVPESADFVMYWWRQCAALVVTGAPDAWA
jgi:hypothetical protein